MRVKRTISKGRIIAALFIAALIFLLGLILGMLIDTQRIQWSDQQSKQQRLDYESLQWQYLYLTSSANKEQTCAVLHTALEDSIVDLGASLDKIQSYRKQSQINDKDYKIIERSYAVDNLKYWLLAKKTKEECGADNVIILYFFSEDKCEICSDQGVILTYYKKKYEEKLLVFPINVDLAKDEPSVKIVESVYNITTFPSIVIQDTKYENVVPTERLGDIICDSFNNKNNCID